jgi:CubicO group peptidase (beta-lactamase class C family)
VDEGKLGWDDPVASHLPGFELYDPYATMNATVRDLLAHRTGLPAFTGDLLGEMGYDREEVLARARYLTPQGTFRETANYSNVGFLMAGMLTGEGRRHELGECGALEAL